MPFEIPTKADWVLSWQQSVQVNLPGSDPLLPGPEFAIVAAGSGAVHEDLKHSQKRLYRAPPSLKMSDEDALDNAQAYGVQLIEAAFASGSIRFTSDVDGTIVPDETEVQAGSFTYLTQGAVVIAGGIADVTVVATVAGSGGNLAEGQTVQLTTPIDDIDADATVLEGGIVGGADEQTIDELKQVLIDKPKKNAMNNGSKGNYIAWALEVPGVESAWEVPGYPSIFNVGVFVQLDGATQPNQSKIDEITEYLESPGKAPYPYVHSVQAPTYLVQNFTIHLYEDSAANRKRAKDGLTNFYATEVEMGEGLLHYTDLVTAIKNELGSDHFDLNAPAANIVVAPQQLPRLGTVSFV